MVSLATGGAAQAAAVRCVVEVVEATAAGRQERGARQGARQPGCMHERCVPRLRPSGLHHRH